MDNHPWQFFGYLEHPETQNDPWHVTKHQLTCSKKTWLCTWWTGWSISLIKSYGSYDIVNHWYLIISLRLIRFSIWFRLVGSGFRFLNGIWSCFLFLAYGFFRFWFFQFWTGLHVYLGQPMNLLQACIPMNLHDPALTGWFIDTVAHTSHQVLVA